jgi:hypothetical protein
MTYFVLKYLHVTGACVLLGTGAGIAFFMLMAHLSGRPAVVAGVARIVVIADFLFTATAVVAQPITGVLLVNNVGYSLWDRPSGCQSCGCRCACAISRGRRPTAAVNCRSPITACSGGGSRSGFRRSEPYWQSSG